MKRYKLLIIICSLCASSLLATANARNDVWQTAVPMGSSAAGTFRSTSVMRDSRPATTVRYTSPYGSSSSGVGHYKTYNTTSSSKNKMYQSSSAKKKTYGILYNWNGTYNTYKYQSRHNDNITSIASTTPRSYAAPMPTIGPNNNSYIYGTHSLTHTLRGVDTGDTKFEGGVWWIYNGSTWVEMATEPDYEVGDKKYEDGQWWTYNGTEWVPEAAEPMPIGSTPWLLMLALPVAYLLRLRTKETD